VNPIDWKICVGYVKGFINLTFPYVLGYDLSGVIVAVGSAVEREGRLHVGQAVWADAGTRGAYATHVVVSTKYVAPKPSKISHLQAATLPLVALTAYQSFQAAGLTAGHKVLVLGASGGVGFVAVYIAKALGFSVTATCSEKNVAFVTSLGADRVVDYTKESWSEVLKGDGSEEAKYDAIFDTVGDKNAWARAPAVLKRGHTFVAVAGNKGEDGVEDQGQSYTYKFVVCNSNYQDLAKIGELVETGAIHAHIDSVFPLEEVAQAFVKSQAGKVVGKIAIKVKEES